MSTRSESGAAKSVPSSFSLPVLADREDTKLRTVFRKTDSGHFTGKRGKAPALITSVVAFEDPASGRAYVCTGGADRIVNVYDATALFERIVSGQNSSLTSWDFSSDQELSSAVEPFPLLFQCRGHTTMIRALVALP